MFKNITAFVLLLVLSTSFVFANENPSNKIYRIQVHGIVCELCSYGVAKNIRKLDFIDKNIFDKGVKVDIKQQQVFVSIDKEKSLDKDRLFKAIKSGGYEPVSIEAITPMQLDNINKQEDEK